MNRGQLEVLTLATEWYLHVQLPDGWELRGEFATQTEAAQAAEPFLTAGHNCNLEQVAK